MDLPLSDVRVVDLTQYEAGPSATQILAWLGADVIKVEPPGGEPGRHLAGATASATASSSCCSTRASAASCSTSSSAEDRAHLRALLRSADVLAENFAPDTLERFGLPLDELAREFPRLIVASVRGYASGGPWSDVQVARLRRPGGRRRDERHRRARTVRRCAWGRPSPTAAPACTSRSASSPRSSAARAPDAAGGSRWRCRTWS